MFNEFPDQRTVDRLRTLYPTGTRVVLEKMDDPYTRLRPGDSGKVVHIAAAGGIHIQWDNGSCLAAIYGVDYVAKVVM